VSARGAVFLDRDGVLVAARVVANRPYPPASADEVELLPGVVDACSRLRTAGYALLVVTNQPDIARGTTTRESVDAINRRVAELVAVDGIYVCPHDDSDRCDCRKPKPGLLLQASREWDIDLGHSFMVGDRWRDVAAGKAAGCANIFIDCEYDEPRPQGPDVAVLNLTEAAEWILHREVPSPRSEAATLPPTSVR
jgi:D-glycero-D-manno-heptose 1,7-bisphosphate phosphatase